MTVIFLVAMLGFAGLAIDVGHAYLVQRQLQSGVDAAALAGVQELPDGATAITTAETRYGPSPGASPNHVTSVDNATTTASLKCVQAVGCIGKRPRPNALQVTASSSVPTWFAKVLGFGSFTVHAKATACSPCTAKKFDIMLVFDRSASMGSADLKKAKDGIKQFLQVLDPELDHVGLGVFPPAKGPAAPTYTIVAGRDQGLPSSDKRFGYDLWWPSWDPRTSSGQIDTGDTAIYTVASLSDDYLVPSGSNWIPNSSSSLVQRVENQQPPTGSGYQTSYADALIEAKHELAVHGRPDAPDVIVFFTDGAANTMPKNIRLPDAAPGVRDGLTPIDLEGNRTKPCAAAIQAATWAKGLGGTQIYTIGYDLASDNSGAGDCAGKDASKNTLKAMATDPATDFYDANITADVGLVFEQIARDIVKPSGQLIDDNLS